MARCFLEGKHRSLRKGYAVLLPCIWTLGLVSGAFSFCFAESFPVSLMRGVLMDSVSIVDLLFVSLLPFLISAAAVSFSVPWLLLLTAFGKTFLFSFVSAGILCSFGSAGWLFRLLLMCSELLMVPLLYWYMRRQLSVGLQFSFVELLAVLSVCVLIGAADYGYILPFLAGMINS